MDVNENAIAIVGIDLNLPGCQQVDEYWNILLNSVECIEDVPVNKINNLDNYVNRMSVCKDYDKFDAAFFGYSKHEAKVMDPQHRLFLQSCWRAIENAGYKVSQLEGNIGVFGSAGYNTYLIQAMLHEEDYINKKGYYDVLVGNDKDYMSTKVSYKLGLKGPSMNVQTACSSSLVGIHLACQSLLMGESDMCLAGGACVRVPCEQGYEYQQGFIQSKDGHCRPFDEEGSGTVFGSGVGVVVLKRLEDAIEQKDTIYSVIRASAINNDGDRKISFTAPSYEGQTDVTQTVLSLEDIEKESIRFIEAHGTGTILGDPIELNSIMNTFSLESVEENAKFPCAIGSVKSNIGHLDTAAGIAGLIKASLCIYHKKIVPTLHFKELNRKTTFKDTRFYISNKVEDIKNNEYPIRAAVSAFGVGGTNVSIILEEPPKAKTITDVKEIYPVVMSAKTKISLEAMLNNVKKIDKKHMGSISYTLNTRREEFDYRAYIMFSKQGNEKEFQIVKESEINQLSASTEVEIAFLLDESSYKLCEHLYKNNEVYKRNIDSWMKHFNKQGKIFNTDSVDENTKKIKDFVFQVSMAETLYFYCKELEFSNSSILSYIKGYKTKSELFDLFLTKSWGNSIKEGKNMVTVKEISLLSLYEVLSKVWIYGLSVDWDKIYTEEEKRQVPAPTYEFEKKRYWYEENNSLVWCEKKKKLNTPLRQFDGKYVIFAKQKAEKSMVYNQIKLNIPNSIYLDSMIDNDISYEEFKNKLNKCDLINELQIRLVFLLEGDNLTSINKTFFNCLNIINWCNKELNNCKEISVMFIHVKGCNKQKYSKMMLFDGIANTLTKELSNIKVKQIVCESITDSVIKELTYIDNEMKVWVENGNRYGICFEEIKGVEKRSLLKENGTYLITGGTGNVGIIYAQEIIKRVKANIILISQNYNEEEIFTNTSEKCQSIKFIIEEFRKKGNNVEIVKVDITDEIEWKKQLKLIKKKYKKIDGIIHAAGKVGKALDYVDKITYTDIEKYMKAKVDGAFIINDVFNNTQLDFCIYTSSTVSYLGGIGDIIYSGANAVLNEISRNIDDKNGVIFSTILDYMPRVFKDEYVVENDATVKNLLDTQLSMEEFSIACDDIFTNTNGENLIITKTNFQKRYQKEKDIRTMLNGSIEETLDKKIIEKEDIKHIVQNIWNRILENDCDDSVNFFDAGGDSFLAIKLIAELNKEFSLKLPIQYMYEFPTIKYMTNNLYEQMLDEIKRDNICISNYENITKENTYVVGMAGRFPDADNIDELWDNILNKKQSISHFDKDEYTNALNAVPDGKYNQYIGARAIMNDIDKFDYQFFGISSLEAKLMDPQQRVFLEIVWNALEDAGCINLLEDAKVGVFASQGISSYLVNVLLENDKIKEDYNNVAVVNNSPDALATRVAYLLNLTGVCKTVQTFCSSSLVALEDGVSAIESGKCDLAVVGGVNIVVPQQSGYIYNESSIYSNTGEIKPFDDSANGTVFGNGAGVVILASESFVKTNKLHTYAQIVGLGINNDGSQKASFLSPSIKGQAECILEAYKKAGIDPSKISYIETHGTATNVGDPIEIHALERVFKKGDKSLAHCALGSIKGNIGHLDRAAGITSFIKGCLIAEKHCIPPVAGFEKINKHINLDGTPFYINKEIVKLEENEEIYLGVTALGVGGTNVHVVLKSTDNEVNTEQSNRKYIIPLSAKCKESLLAQREKLADFLKKEEVNLSTLEYVMQTQRKSFSKREVIVTDNKFELINKLEESLELDKHKKVNTIVCQCSTSEEVLVNILERLINEEKWIGLKVKEEFGCDSENIYNLIKKYPKKILEYCIKKCITDLVTDKVIILMVNESDISNIALDDRVICLHLLESSDIKNEHCVMTPTDTLGFNKVIASLWCSGIDVDWEKYNYLKQKENIHLPGYEFKKTKCWI